MILEILHIGNTISEMISLKEELMLINTDKQLMYANGITDKMLSDEIREIEEEIFKTTINHTIIIYENNL